MASKGFDLRDPNDLVNELGAKLGDLRRQARREGGDVQSNAALARLQRHELDLARIDLGCRDAVGLDEVIHEVRTAFEKRFIAARGRQLATAWSVDVSDGT